MTEEKFTKTLTKALSATEEKFTKILTKALADQDNRLMNRIDQRFDEHSRDLKDFVASNISASEKRTKKEILEGVVDFIDRSVIPQFDNHERRLTRLERKLA